MKIDLIMNALIAADALISIDLLAPVNDFEIEKRNEARISTQRLIQAAICTLKDIYKYSF
jgi:hypothetical protein